MMLFQLKLGWNVLKLLGRSVDSARCAPLQKQETKMIDGARPLPLRCLSQFFPVEEKINYLGNEVLVFIMDNHDNFPSWMMTRNNIFPCWRMIQYSSH